ncbi:unnamed protein product, partial [Scytosiphon promiscuus]
TGTTTGKCCRSSGRGKGRAAVETEGLVGNWWWGPSGCVAFGGGCACRAAVGLVERVRVGGRVVHATLICGSIGAREFVEARVKCVMCVRVSMCVCCAGLCAACRDLSNSD